MSTTTAASEPQAEAATRRRLLEGLDIVPPDHEAEAVLARLAQWESSLKPWDVYECWLLFLLARETIRMERLHQREIAARHEQALGAEHSWDEDRFNEAEALAENLSRYPAKTLAALRRFSHGCAAIIRRWETLTAALDRCGTWDAPERVLALNLLNVPRELRKSPGPLDIPDGTDPLDHLRSVAAAQIARHRDLAAALAPVDLLRREALKAGLGPDTAELAGIRQEERAADRRLAWCRSQFKTTRPAPRPPDRGDLPADTPPKSQRSPLPAGGPRPSAADWKASHASPLAAWKAAQAARAKDSPGADPSEAPDPPRSIPKSRSRRRRA